VEILGISEKVLGLEENWGKIKQLQTAFHPA